MLSNQPQLSRVTSTALLSRWGRQLLKDMTSLGTDFETHAIWQGYVEDPLSWDCRMLACRPEGQNDRHILCRRHVGQHVGQHVANMSKKHVGRRPLMSADMLLANMSADMSVDMSVI
jgi:hypothetical protein